MRIDDWRRVLIMILCCLVAAASCANDINNTATIDAEHVDESRIDQGFDLVEDTPENCAKFDGDEAACTAAGCNLFNKHTSYCVKDGSCVVDARPSEVCANTLAKDSLGLSWAFIRDSDGRVVEFVSRGPTGDAWRACPEDPEDSPNDACRCFWSDNSIEGECP